MPKVEENISRRSFLKKSAMGAGALALSMSPLGRAFGQAQFPASNFNVAVTTGAGGGAERIARSFTAVWQKYLNDVGFEYEFYPGAGGQLGYNIYLNRKPRDGYHLIFGNMGPDMIAYTLQNPDYRFPDDFHYLARVDVDDSTLFVRRGGRFETVEQLVEEGRRRPVTVAVSRIPHPASIGVLALGEATGAQFILVPYGGGRSTVVAVMGGEVDCGALPTGNPIQLQDELRVVGVFSDDNKLAPLMGNPPSINDVFGTNIPELPSARGWGIHTSVREQYPERYEVLTSTVKKVFDDPEFEQIYRATGAPWEAIQYGDAETCRRYAQTMIDMAERYRSILTGGVG